MSSKILSTDCCATSRAPLRSCSSLITASGRRGGNDGARLAVGAWLAAQRHRIVLCVLKLPSCRCGAIDQLSCRRRRLPPRSFAAFLETGRLSVLLSRWRSDDRNCLGVIPVQRLKGPRGTSALRCESQPVQKRQLQGFSSRPDAAS